MQRKLASAAIFLSVAAAGTGLGYYTQAGPGRAIADPNVSTSAVSDWNCADRGQQVSFCVATPPAVETKTLDQEIALPKVALMATLHGIKLETVPMTWGDLWVEDKVPAKTRALIASSLDADLTRISADFGRPFTDKPRIVTFASARSFSAGLQTLFGYPSAVADSLAANNGGALVVKVRSIALNWDRLTGERPLTILRHEFAHAISREIAGAKAQLPSWFDEGLATNEQETFPERSAALEEHRYAAAALVASGRADLARLVSADDWQRQTVALNGRSYSVASAATEILTAQIGHVKVLDVLRGMGSGKTFVASFQDATGLALADFMRDYPRRLAEAAPPRLVTQPTGNGEVLWTIKGFAPKSSAHVTVDDGKGYKLAFDVAVDELGAYTSTFGSTAPKGQYAVRVEDGGAVVTGSVAAGR